MTKRKKSNAHPLIIDGMPFSEQEYEEIRKVQREHDVKLADAALMFTCGRVSHATAKIHLEKLKKALGKDHTNE
jgi:hypothetical protein